MTNPTDPIRKQDIPELVCSPPRSEWFRKPTGPDGVEPDCGLPRSEWFRHAREDRERED